MKARSPWLSLCIVLLLSIAAAFSQFKVAPVLPLLMKSMALSPARAGSFMSTFALTGLVLSIPSGFIFQKFGYRASGLIIALSLALGSALGAVSGHFTPLLLSRTVEGFGLCFTFVAGPAIVAALFPPEKLGKPMGIWTMWMPAGGVIVFLVAPAIAQAWGWQGVWWAACLFALAAGILFLAFVRVEPRLPASQLPSDQDWKGETPLAGNAFGGASPRPLPPPSPWLVLRSGQVWLISLLFFCINFVFISFVTWMPTVLHVVKGISLAQASALAAIMVFLSIPACPLAGMVSDALGSRKVISVVPMLVVAPVIPLTFHVGLGAIVPLLALIGIMAGIGPTGAYAAIPGLAPDPRLSGMAMAVVLIGQNVAMLVGPVVIGAIAGTAGWQVAILALAPVSLLGAATAWVSRMK